MARIVDFLICTLPVVIWNWQHGWITVHHVAGDAGLHSQWKPTLRYFWDFSVHELVLLNPIFFIGSIVAMFGFWKLRREKPLWLYFFCMSAPVLLGHLLYSFHSRVLPNWIAVAILPMLCLMVAYWDARWRAGSRWLKPCLVIGLAFGFLAAAFMYDSKLIGKIAGQPLPGEKDPSRRVNAWKQSAELVEIGTRKTSTGRQTRVHHLQPLRYHRAVFILFAAGKSGAPIGAARLFHGFGPAAKPILFLAGIQLSRTSQRPKRHFCQRSGPISAGARLVLEMADASAG